MLAALFVLSPPSWAQLSCAAELLDLRVVPLTLAFFASRLARTRIASPLPSWSTPCWVRISSSFGDRSGRLRSRCCSYWPLRCGLSYHGVLGRMPVP